MEKDTRSAVPIRCSRCGTVLGVSLHDSLSIGGVLIESLVVTVTCVKCGQKRVWRPERQRVTFSEEERPVPA